MIASPKLLSVHPLWLLAAVVVGFGVWVAYDAARPIPNTAEIAPEEPPPSEQDFVLVAPEQPPLHPGMPRQLAEQVLNTHADGPEVADTARGIPVRRVSYRVQTADLPKLPRHARVNWTRVTVEYDATHPMQPLLTVSAVPAERHVPSPVVPEQPD